MMFAAVVGHRSGRATPSLRDAPQRQSMEAVDRETIYRSRNAVQTKPATSLFKRIRGSINEHFADPGFGPREVAADARISLRYLQKLFAAQNSTCSSFIDSVRLGHAARL